MFDDIPLESRKNKITEFLTICCLMGFCFLAMLTLGILFTEGLRGIAEWLHV